jgi:hypothetical protein
MGGYQDINIVLSGLCFTGLIKRKEISTIQPSSMYKGAVNTGCSFFTFRAVQFHLGFAK